MAQASRRPDSDDLILSLEATIDRLERELAHSRRLMKETRRSHTAELDRVQAELQAVTGRPTVRVAIAATGGAEEVDRFGRRVVGSVRRRLRGAKRRVARVVRHRRLRATPQDEVALTTALVEGLPGTSVDHGPLVSIIIVNRDGRDHLERCLSAIATTAYRDIEVIVVDNGSRDGSPEFAESFALPFPIRVIRNRTNRSFSEANAQGVAIATGRLMCFLNNDVDPIERDWLGYMVETMTSRDAVAVGARLIYPRHRGGARAGQELPDLSLQHAGVGFDRSLGVPHARVIGAGDEALAAWAGEVEERPALTAACLLVQLDAFRKVGGFSRDYDYGIEDIDLCLKLRAAGGRLVYDGRAALWHHESATRAADRDRFAARVAANRRTFIDLWGPRIYRDALVDALRGGSRFSDDPFHIAIAAPAGESEAEPDGRRAGGDLGDALETLGWRVTYPTGADGTIARDRSIEAVIVLDGEWDPRRLPRSVITIAWITDDPERWIDTLWFDDFDIVFAANDAIAGVIRDRSTRVARPMRIGRVAPTIAGVGAPTPNATAIRDGLTGWALATRYGIRIELADLESVDLSDDSYLARGLQRHLERQGHPTRIHPLPEWSTPTAARDDVALHLYRTEEAPTHRSQVDVLWDLGDPGRAAPAVYERYDHVFVSPGRFDEGTADGLSVTVEPLDPTATFDRSARAICDVADRLADARPSGIDGNPISS